MNWHSMTKDERTTAIREGMDAGMTLTEIGVSLGLSRQNASRAMRLFCDNNRIPFDAPQTIRRTGWDIDEGHLREWIERQDRDFIAAVRTRHFGVPA